MAQLRNEALTLGANALAGGVVAGVIQRFRTGSFGRAFRRGAVGGGVTFAGKRVAVEPFSGAGLFGRELAAMGSSMVRSAAAGQPSLSELVLPVGPLRLYVRPSADRPVRVQADLAAAVSLAQAMSDSDLAFDVGSSLSAGAPVFRQRVATRDTPWKGRATAGVFRLSGETWARGPDHRSRVLAHEVVHALQYDQGFLLLGDPLETALLSRVPGGPFLSRRVHLGTDLPIWYLLNKVVPYQNRPWETEAYLLSRTRPVEDRTRAVVVGSRADLPAHHAHAWR